MISILLITADPTDETRLRLGEEAREIQERLQLAKLRDNFMLHQRFSVRPPDISQALLDINSQVVHFSGHGTVNGALCIEDRIGKMHPLEPEALAALFEQFSDEIKCVVLNACYSEKQAIAIARSIDYVIGMQKAIGDRAAVSFSLGFYQALGAGRSIEESYQLGCVQIRLENIPEHMIPVLITNKKKTNLKTPIFEGKFNWAEIKLAIETTFELDKCFVLDSELDRFIGLRSAEANFAVMLLGDQGSGKSILLKKLIASPKFKTYKAAYIDLAKPSMQYPSIFWREIISCLTNSDPGELDGYSAMRILDQLSLDQHYILCLDNIDRLIQKKTFDLRTIEYLRHLLYHSVPLSLVVTTCVPTSHLRSDEHFASSPWHNIFVEMRLTEISERRARKLLTNAGIKHEKQVNFCLKTVEKFLPEDLLILAYYVLKQTPSNNMEYEKIARSYKAIIAEPRTNDEEYERIVHDYRIMMAEFHSRWEKDK